MTAYLLLVLSVATTIGAIFFETRAGGKLTKWGVIALVAAVATGIATAYQNYRSNAREDALKEATFDQLDKTVSRLASTVGTSGICAADRTRATGARERIRELQQDLEFAIQQGGTVLNTAVLASATRLRETLSTQRVVMERYPRTFAERALGDAALLQDQLCKELGSDAGACQWRKSPANRVAPSCP
jgi:hypothetical protein